MAQRTGGAMKRFACRGHHSGLRSRLHRSGRSERARPGHRPCRSGPRAGQAATCPRRTGGGNHPHLHPDRGPAGTFGWSAPTRSDQSDVITDDPARTPRIGPSPVRPTSYRSSCLPGAGGAGHSVPASRGAGRNPDTAGDDRWSGHDGSIGRALAAVRAQHLPSRVRALQRHRRVPRAGRSVHRRRSGPRPAGDGRRCRTAPARPCAAPSAMTPHGSSCWTWPTSVATRPASSRPGATSSPARRPADPWGRRTHLGRPADRGDRRGPVPRGAAQPRRRPGHPAVADVPL